MRFFCLETLFNWVCYAAALCVGVTMFRFWFPYKIYVQYFFPFIVIVVHIENVRMRSTSTATQHTHLFHTYKVHKAIDLRIKRK